MHAASPTEQARASPHNAQGKPVIVLLHGLMRGRRSMEGLRRRVQAETGWTAVSLQYPSTRQPIAKLASGVAAQVRDVVQQGGHDGVWAVTHSMGGIVQRRMMGLPDQGGIRWKGIVMIAPPNQGSTVAHQLSNLPGIGKLFKGLYGTAGVELGTEMAQGNVWPDPPQPCGIIAGTKSLSLVNPTSWLTRSCCMIKGPNDGTVAVAETKLNGNNQTDFISLHLPHTTIATASAIVPLVVSFLQSNKFQ